MMLVYDPLTTGTIFKPQLLEIAVVWQDDTHIVGECVVPAGTPSQRVLVEKSKIPTADELEVQDGERLRRMICDYLAPMKNNKVRNDTLRAVVKLIIEEMEE